LKGFKIFGSYSIPVTAPKRVKQISLWWSRRRI